jgi:hypothetical protein
MDEISYFEVALGYRRTFRVLVASRCAWLAD